METDKKNIVMVQKLFQILNIKISSLEQIDRESLKDK